MDFFLLRVRSADWNIHIESKQGKKKKKVNREFPGGLVVRILDFHCHDLGSIPG